MSRVIGILLSICAASKGIAQEQGSGGIAPSFENRFEVRLKMRLAQITPVGAVVEDVDLLGEGVIAMWLASVVGDGGGAIGIGGCFFDVDALHIEITDLSARGKSTRFGEIKLSLSQKLPSRGLLENVRKGSIDGFPATLCIGDATADLWTELEIAPGPTVVFLSSASPLLLRSATPVPTEAVVPFNFTSADESIMLVNSQTGAAAGSLGNIAISFSPQEAAGHMRPGDCNQDGSLDISDAVCVLGFLFLGAPQELPCGPRPMYVGNRMLVDWQRDDAVDLSDAVAILVYLFSNGPPHFLQEKGETCLPLFHCPDTSCR